MKKLYFLTALLATMLMGASCDKKNEVDDPNYDDLEMTLSRNLLQIMVGDKATLQPQWTREIDDNEVSYTWASSNEKVATVSKNGQVEGIALGEATISVRTMYREDEYMAKCKVEVMTNKAVITYQGEVQDAGAKLTVEETSTLQLGAKLAIDKEAVKSVSWTTANAKIAEVNDAGKVTGVAPGSTTITATVISENDIKYTASIQVTVKGLLRLRINGELPGTTPYELGWGETAVITIPDGYSATWSNDDTKGDRVKVSNKAANSYTLTGVAGCVNTNPVTITAVCDEKTMTCKLVVKPSKITISVEKNSEKDLKNLKYGERYSLRSNYESQFGYTCEWTYSAQDVLKAGTVVSGARTLDVVGFAPSGLRITCTYKSGGKVIAESDPYTVTIPYPNFQIRLGFRRVRGTSTTLAITTDGELSSSAEKELASNTKWLKWTASNSNVTINGTKCSFDKLGSVVVTATIGTKSATADLVILPGFEIAAANTYKDTPAEYIYIFPSNVYYDKGSQTFGVFEYASFWTALGDENKKISNSSYTGRIDLLAYGVSSNGTTDPLLTTTDEYKYGSFNSRPYPLAASSSATGPAYCKNLGNLGPRMITREEMEYILKTRKAASKLYSVCRIDLGTSSNRYVKGLLLIPDFYVWPSAADEAAFVPGVHSWDSNTYTYTIDKMRQLVANGAVFLPAAGNRRESGMNVSANDGGYYWLYGDEYRDQYFHFRGSILHFDNEEVRVYKGSETKNNYANRGLAIRLACDLSNQ